MLEITSTAPASGDERTLQRPRLSAGGQSIPVELSLWSIGYPAAARLRVGGAKAVSLTDYAAMRLDRLVSIVDSAMPAAVEAPPDDGYQWFRGWANRLSLLREESVENRPPTMGQGALSQVLRAGEEQLARASEQLDLWIEQGGEVWETPQDEAELRADSARWMVESEGSPASRWTYCVAEGGADELTVELVPATATATQTRVVGSLAILAAAAASIWLMRRPAATDFLYRWPHTIMFLVGIAYWAWLWPSWMGLVIAGVSLFFAWRVGWPGRSLPMERSTVVRMPRSEVVAP
jgi:hypothetical protein